MDFWKSNILYIAVFENLGIVGIHDLCRLSTLKVVITQVNLTNFHTWKEHYEVVLKR